MGASLTHHWGAATQIFFFAKTKLKLEPRFTKQVIYTSSSSDTSDRNIQSNGGWEIDMATAPATE